VVPGVAGELLEGRDVLGEARAPESDPGAQEVLADPLIEAHSAGDLKHVGAGLLADIGDLVDERDLRGQERVGGKLDHLRAGDVGSHERRLERLKATGRHGTPAERESNEREEAILTRLHAGLVQGAPIRDVELSVDEEKALRGFRFLTQKPVLVLLNVGEGDIAREAEIVAGIAGRYEHREAIVDALSARIEMELGELQPDEAVAFMEELGIHGSSLDRVIALSYQLLGLVSFLTAGPDEVRAWPIPSGSTAVDAAGAIHTDLARGFIRAETVAYEDLLELGSMAEARKHGRLRSEGKTYQVKDGDVLEILFSK